jgi:hypothetical protein
MVSSALVRQRYISNKIFRFRENTIAYIDRKDDSHLHRPDQVEYLAQDIANLAPQRRAETHIQDLHKRTGPLYKAKLANGLIPPHPATRFRSIPPWIEYHPVPQSRQTQIFNNLVAKCRNSSVVREHPIPGTPSNIRIVPDGFGAWYRFDMNPVIACQNLCGNIPVAIFSPWNAQGAIVMHIEPMDPHGMIPHMTTLMTIYRDEIPNAVAVVGMAVLEGKTSPTIEAVKEALRMSGVKAVIATYQPTEYYGSFYVTAGVAPKGPSIFLDEEVVQWSAKGLNGGAVPSQELHSFFPHNFPNPVLAINNHRYNS